LPSRILRVSVSHTSRDQWPPAATTLPRARSAGRLALSGTAAQGPARSHTAAGWLVAMRSVASSRRKRRGVDGKRPTTQKGIGVRSGNAGAEAADAESATGGASATVMTGAEYAETTGAGSSVIGGVPEPPQ